MLELWEEASRMSSDLVLTRKDAQALRVRVRQVNHLMIDACCLLKLDERTFAYWYPPACSWFMSSLKHCTPLPCSALFLDIRAVFYTLSLSFPRGHAQEYASGSC